MQRVKRARTLTQQAQPSCQDASSHQLGGLGAQGQGPRGQPARPEAREAQEQVEGDDEGGRWGTYMAVACSGSCVGVAYYDPATGELAGTEALDEPAGPFAHQVLQLAKLHAQPAVIYVSARADEGVVAALRAPLAPAVGGGSPAAWPRPTEGGLAPGGGSGAAGGFDVRLEKSSLFAPAAARAALEAIHVDGLAPPGASSRERLHALNARLSLAREQQVCAAGALLAILARAGLLSAGRGCGAAAAAAGRGPAASSLSPAAASLLPSSPPARGSSLWGLGEEDTLPADYRRGARGTHPSAAAAAFSLSGVSEFSLDGFLTVDPVSMEALQIFSLESHPSAMGIGGWVGWVGGALGAALGGCGCGGSGSCTKCSVGALMDRPAGGMATGGLGVGVGGSMPFPHLQTAAAAAAAGITKEGFSVFNLLCR